jgi:hypothetical protein
MKNVLERFKSPVVIAQIVSIIGALVVAILPEFNEVVEKIVYALTIIINVFAGVNNPTDKDNF